MTVQTYRNPIIPGQSSDPSICRVDKDYFLVTSSFEYSPGIPVYHSRNLVDWTLINNILTRPSQLPLSSTKQHTAFKGIYAVTLRFIFGTFYLITTNESAPGPDDPDAEKASSSERWGMFYVSTKNIFEWGSWSDPIWLPSVQGIDPSLYLDEESGKIVLTSSRTPAYTPPDYIFSDDKHEWGIQAAEIDLATGVLSPFVFLTSGTGGRYPEGPHIYKREGFYYLLISEGGTEYAHSLTVFRSTTLFGPYESSPYNPLLTHRGLQSPIQGVGHGDFFDDGEGNWFIIFHGMRPPSYPLGHILGRETILSPVYFSSDGWPLINTHDAISKPARVFIEMSADLPGPAVAQWPASGTWREDFGDANGRLLPQWNALGWSDTGVANGNSLVLKASKNTLTDGVPVSFVARRQQHLNSSASVLVQIRADDVDTTAGLSVYMNSNHHYDIFVTRAVGQAGLSVVVRRRIGSLEAEVARKELDTGSALRLWIQCKLEDRSYHFGLFDPEEPEKKIELVEGRGEFHYLATEVAGGFTGLFYGVFATGQNGGDATFSDFEYAYVNDQ
ncbi:xylan 1,4-beta-xylosidase [Cladochytrium replicatum]|nr:xylan 1,4-beta-xylosidase [Cladochytrium replicatum]